MDHILGVRLLHGLAVEAHLDIEIVGILDFISCYDPWAGRTCLLKVLAGIDLSAVFLIIAQARLIKARISKHVLERLVCRHVATCILANDREQLGLVIELGGDFGPEDRLSMSGQRFRPTRENHRTVKSLVGAIELAIRLADVVMIIQADADDPARIWNDRNQGQTVIVKIALFVCDNGLRDLQPVARDKLHDRAIHTSDARGQIDDLAIFHCAIVDRAAVVVTNKLHFSVPLIDASRYGFYSSFPTDQPFATCAALEGAATVSTEPIHPTGQRFSLTSWALAGDLSRVSGLSRWHMCRRHRLQSTDACPLPDTSFRLDTGLLDRVMIFFYLSSHKIAQFVRRTRHRLKPLCFVRFLYIGRPQSGSD